uniref:Amino acid transporter n=1 Tax=Phaffia rhodozyma TaxID=264483 RepID=A0A1C9U6A1_PHARH|nr:amino acid transporter [Phaffia rhodozyma]
MTLFGRANSAPASASPTGSQASYTDEKDGVVDEKVLTDIHVSELDSAGNAIHNGQLGFDDSIQGGLGRHLGLVSTTLLVVGRIIGTGIFSTPATILKGVGSPGAALCLWVFGYLLSMSGLLVWIELGCMFPRSGGEKVYLEAAYKNPKYLMTILFAVNAIFLGFTASGCIVFANNILTAAGVTASQWNARGIAVGVIFFVTALHTIRPGFGIKVMNFLTIVKIALLSFVVVTGWVVLGGGISKTKVADPHSSFRNSFEGTSSSSYAFASAIFKVLNSYSGWSNSALVLNEVKNPVRTLKIAGPAGLTLCFFFYLFANIAYFAATPVATLKTTSLTVASQFFGVVFNAQAKKAVSVFVALSALGNVITVTFAQSRVNQELAKEGILPWSKALASNWPFGSPFAGLIVHLIPSVIVILAPPPGIAYNFILDIEGYPGQIINLLVVVGLFYLRWKYPNINRPFKVWLPVAVFFMAAACFLLVAPFLRPPGGIGDTPPLPYWLYPIIGIAVFAMGIVWWFVWRVLLPRLGNYKLVSRVDTLSDGTRVTQFDKVKND